MEDKTLIPAHVFFARWFIRIRWISVIFLVIVVGILSVFFNIGIQNRPIFIICLVIIALNTFHFILLRKIRRANRNHIVLLIKREIHFQIITDLILLTALLHYTGGIENPMIILFFLHMIIASSIFSRIESYIHTGIAIILPAILALFEYFEIIQHYPLAKIGLLGLYQNTLYLIGSGVLFIFMSFLIVGLTHLIKYKSITIEETYVRTNQELKKRDELQNQYVQRVTHAIKGHLAAIISRLSVVNSKIIGPLNEEQVEFVGRALKRTEQLSEFVQGILSLSRKRLMKESEIETFSLRETILKVVSRVQVLAEDKSISLNVFVDESVNDFIGNPTTIEELYSNLMRNSIFYTPEGGRIRLSVKDKKEKIVSEITDSGIGIPKDEIPKIFEEFFRGSNAKKNGVSGSGLGLSIAKQIIDNHHGTIQVDSEPGIWTKFTFTLPKISDLTDIEA